MNVDQGIYTVLLLLPAGLVVWGIYQCVTGIRTAHRVQGTLAIVLGLSIYVAGMVITDYDIAQRTERQIEICHQHLEEVGRAIAEFKAKKGRLPSSLMELYNEMQVPLCVVHKGETDAGYFYRLPRGSGERQILCLDARPHVYNYRFLKAFRRSYRNVLYLDGTVATLEESEIPIMTVGGQP